MSLRFDLYGPDGKGEERRPHVHAHHDGHTGLVVLTDPFRQLKLRGTFFVNPSFGAAMNQDRSFGNIPSIIYAGASASAKTGSADTNTTDKLDITVGGSGFTAAASVGMTVENTVDSEYARVSAVDSDTVLALSTLGAPNGADLFPDGTDAFILNATWAASGAASWDFTTDISLTSGNDNDEAIFDADAKDLSTATDFVALSMSVNLSTYSASQHDILLQLREAGVAVGVAVRLNNFIDTGNFSAQTVAIPIGFFELGTTTFNGLSMTVERTGGAKPSIDFDDIQLETGSEALSYRVTPRTNTRFAIHELIFSFVDALDIDRASASVPELSYDKILGDNSLTSGLVLNWVENGKVRLSRNLRSLYDFMSAGGRLTNIIADGTNTAITISLLLEPPLEILGAVESNYLEIVIQDDLSTQVVFTCFARGAEEER